MLGGDGAEGNREHPRRQRRIGAAGRYSVVRDLPPGAEHLGRNQLYRRYPFAEGSTATLDIGGTTFELFTEGEYAWPATPADDQKIVTAIKRGADATITARSSRGTQTKDTFSLLGATAMIEEAEKLCSG